MRSAGREGCPVLFLGRWRNISDRQELSLVRVKGKNFARLKLVDPAVKFQFAAARGGCHRRMGPQIFELDEYVFLDRQRQSFVGIGQIRVILLDDAPSRLGVLKIGTNRWQCFNGLRVEKSRHGATVRMTADDDVSHLEYVDGVFNRCGFTAVDGGVRWYDVARGLLNEQLARLCLSQSARIDARVRAGDEQGLRFLAFGQRLEELPISAERVSLELVDSLNELLHSSALLEAQRPLGPGLVSCYLRGELTT